MTEQPEDCVIRALAAANHAATNPNFKDALWYLKAKWDAMEMGSNPWKDVAQKTSYCMPIRNRDARLAAFSRIFERPIASSYDLTFGEATALRQYYAQEVEQHDPE